MVAFEAGPLALDIGITLAAAHCASTGGCALRSARLFDACNAVWFFALGPPGFGLGARGSGLRAPGSGLRAVTAPSPSPSPTSGCVMPNMAKLIADQWGRGYLNPMTLGCRSNFFCPLPWVHLDTRTSGDVRICCHASHGPNGGILKNAEGQTYNLANPGALKNSRNAPLLKDVRRTILNGDFHSECHRCRKEESAGILSRRQVEAELWKDTLDFDQAKALTDKDGGVNEELAPRYLSLRFGNHCNLRCRMCSPTESAAWYHDFVELNGHRGFHDGGRRLQLEVGADGRYREPTAVYQWHESETFWDDFLTIAPSVETIYMAGGEPFLIRRHFEFLKRCIESGHAANMALEYNTNMTLLPPELTRLWLSFKSVRLGCSLDGVGAVNDYIRYPSRFENIESNLHQVDQMGPAVSGWIATTVSALNIFYLDELIQWRLKAAFQKINDPDGPQPLITAHPLHRPAYLHINVLPAHVKEAVTLKLRRVVNWVEDFAATRGIANAQKANWIKDARAITESYVDLMMQEDRSDLLPEFWRKTRRLDHIRGQSIETSLPEFFALMKGTEHQ